MKNRQSFFAYEGSPPSAGCSCFASSWLPSFRWGRTVKVSAVCKLRRRAGREFIIDRLVRVEGRDVHFIVVPLVAEGLRPRKRLIHELPEKRLVAVRKFQLAEGGENQIFLHFLDLPERCDGPARGIVAQDRNAVIGAACAVVKILFAAEVGAPVGKEGHILPLPAPLPDSAARFLREFPFCTAWNTARGRCGQIVIRCLSSCFLPYCFRISAIFAKSSFASWKTGSIQ